MITALYRSLEFINVFKEIVAAINQGLLLVITHTIECAIDHGHPWILGKLFPMAMNEMPIQCVEGTAIGLDGMLHLVMTFFAIVRHLVDVIARSCVGFTG